MAEHPVLKAKPTLTDVQDYASSVLKYRGLNGNTEYGMLLLCEEVGELAKAIRKHGGGKMAADSSDFEVEHEAADVLWMLVSVCNSLGIDLEQALHDKAEKNKTRIWK